MIPDIDNLAALDGTQIDATVGSGRAVISGNIAKSATFADRDLPQKSSLKRLKLRQSLDSNISIALPTSAVAPASITLTNFALLVKLSDSDSRTAEASATLAGPLTFTRQGTTNIYTRTTPAEISGVTFDGAKFTTVRDIITTAPTPNTVSARLSFDANDSELPSGAVVKFTLVGGKAKVEL